MSKTRTREQGDGDAAALDRLAEEDAGSRAQFLKMVGGAGAAGALAIFVAACGDDDDEDTSSPSTSSDSGSTNGASEKGDLAIVNYALTLEHLESAFYQQVLESGEIKDPKLGDVAKSISEDEMEHVQALTATVEQLGGKPAKAPKTAFEDVIAGGPEMILKTAASVENLGAAAYLGQAGNIKSKEILAAALSIHSNEGRHAAVLNQAAGKSIVPDGAFAVPATMDAVLEAVQPFIQA